MKYIRIKNGVYKGRKIGKGQFEIDVNEYLGYRISDKDEDVRFADTIEELCDEFVCLENKMIFNDLETITSSCNLKHLTVYGAIWTSKGLIYVSKMNEKGGMELL